MANVIAKGPHSTLNLNLGSDVIEQALRSPRGFVGYLTDRLTRSLKRNLGVCPDYFFMVEGTPLRSFHIHGVIGLPDEIARKAVRKAVAEAGGNWSRIAPERKVDLAVLWGMSGWLRYISKVNLLTVQELETARR